MICQDNACCKYPIDFLNPVFPHVCSEWCFSRKYKRDVQDFISRSLFYLTYSIMCTFLREKFSDSCCVSFATVLECSISCFFRESLSIPACWCHLLRSSSRAFTFTCSFLQASACVQTWQHTATFRRQSVT